MILKNPYINALLASLYIVLVIFVVQNFTDGQKPETLLIPITMLSVFVLSVAVMATLFFLTPVKMFLENQKKEAGIFFLKTLLTFAGLVLVLVLALVSL